MNKKVVIYSTVSLMFANVAMAFEVPLPAAAVPLEDGGILAIAAACLALGIRIIQRKRNH